MSNLAEQRVTEMLRDGRLPRGDAPAINVTKEGGATCTVCDEKIADIEYELFFSEDHRLALHLDCFRLWQQLKEGSDVAR